MHRNLWAGLLVAVSTAAGCEGEGSRSSEALSTNVQQERRPASETARRLTGLSHMPAPVDGDALDASLRKHYPREFIGIRPRTAVLVDVKLDERGRVGDVVVVDRPPSLPDNVSMVILDKVPGSNVPVEREYSTTYDSAFGPAARAALKEVRFQPAIRDGRAVPYTLRMTVEFTSPTAS